MNPKTLTDLFAIAVETFLTESSEKVLEAELAPFVEKTLEKIEGHFTSKTILHLKKNAKITALTRKLREIRSNGTLDKEYASKLKRIVLQGAKEEISTEDAETIEEINKMVVDAFNDELLGAAKKLVEATFNALTDFPKVLISLAHLKTMLDSVRPSQATEKALKNPLLFGLTDEAIYQHYLANTSGKNPNPILLKTFRKLLNNKEFLEEYKKELQTVDEKSEVLPVIPFPRWKPDITSVLSEKMEKDQKLSPLDKKILGWFSETSWGEFEEQIAESSICD